MTQEKRQSPLEAIIEANFSAQFVREAQLLGAIAAKDRELKHLRAHVDALQEHGSKLVRERQARLEHDANRERLLESLRADNDALRIALALVYEEDAP